MYIYINFSSCSFLAYFPSLKGKSRPTGSSCCLCVCVLSVFEPMDRFWRNVLWKSWHWLTPQWCNFL